MQLTGMRGVGITYAYHILCDMRGVGITYAYHILCDMRGVGITYACVCVAVPVIALLLSVDVGV